MKGKVVLLNPRKAMAALLTENGEYTSFAILRGCDVELGDIMSGELESFGSETWHNETKSEKVEVMIEDIYGNKRTALRNIS